MFNNSNTYYSFKYFLFVLKESLLTITYNF